MRTPQQEAKRIPLAFKDGPVEGQRIAILYHEDGPVECPPGDSYGDAISKAREVIEQRFPGRTL